MREKARVLWWKITNSIRNNRIWVFFSNNKIGKQKLSRALAWGGSIIVAIVLVAFTAIFLNTNRDNDTYAAGSGDPPASTTVTWRMDDCTSYNPLYSHLAIGCNGFVGTILSTANEEVEGAAGLSIPFSCSASGIPSPTVGTVMSGTFSLVGIDMVGGTATYAGSVSGSGNMQTIQGSFTVPWDFFPGQPVTESIAVNKDAGEVFQDTLGVREADKDGYLTNDGPWGTGWTRGKPANFTVSVHGPFYDYINRSPTWTGSCGDYSNKFFCSGNLYPEVVITDNNIVMIGDGAANQAYSNWNASQRGLFSSVSVAASKTWTGAIADINSRVNSNTAFLVLSLGHSDMPTTVGAGAITEATWTTRVNAAISAAKARNPNIKIGIVGLYDLSNYSDGDLMFPDGSGTLRYNVTRSQINFTNAIDTIATNRDDVFVINWVPASFYASTSPSTGYQPVRYYSSLDLCTTNGYLPSTATGCKFGVYGIDPLMSGVNIYYEVIYEALRYQTLEAPNPTVDAARWGWGTEGGESFPTTNQKSTASFSVSGPSGGYGQTVSFSGSNTYPAGIYYYVSRIRKSGSSDWVFLEEWASPFGGSPSEWTSGNKEHWIAYINYGVHSVASTNFIDNDSKNLDRTDYLTDTLTISPYNAKNGAKEGGAVSRYDESNNLKNSNNWQNWPQSTPGTYLPVNVCVTAYGPYQTPQAQKLQNSDLSAEPKPSNPTICQNMSPSINNGVSDFVYTNSGDWVSGYYYFVSTIDKSNQIPSVALCMEDDYWTSRFNPEGESEWFFRKFQPFATSTTIDGQCEGPTCTSGGDYVSTGEDAVDYIKVWAATDSWDSTGNYVTALQNANDGVINSDESSHRYWPHYAANEYVPVKYKVHMFGPYQTPQERISNDNANDKTGATAPNATLPWPSTGNMPGLTCSDVCEHRIVEVNGVSGNNSIASGNGITPNVNTLNGGKGLAVNFGSVTKPGYYYYTIEVVREEQTQQVTLNPSHLFGRNPVRNYILSLYWKSEFNPNYGDQVEEEWMFRKFQPFITSNVYNSTRNDWQPWVDVKEDNATGEDIIDRVVARASRTLVGAQNGFQYRARDTETDADGDGNGEQYWPKYDSTAGTNAGKYVPVLYKFYICGPFQYPQNEGTTPDMKNPTATNTTNEYQNNYGAKGTACNGNNTLKTIAKYITPNSCSRNPVVKNPDGTYQSPTANGNAMVTYSGGYIADGSVETNTMKTDNTCEINFGRTDQTGTYYQPGYYYFTSEMIKEDQTTYASASLNPGLSSQTPVKNFILSDWHSMFNPLFTQTVWPRNTLNEIEWAYVQMQPIARSYAGATQDERSQNENKWTTRPSYQYLTDRDNQYKAVQLSCNEHYYMPTWSDMNNDPDFWDKVPPKELTCEKISDRIYIGTTTTKDVNYSNKIVKDDNLDEKHWPKTNDIQSGENGVNYEVYKYRVKLYGPFATASVMTGGTLQTTPSAENEAGKTVTVVPSNNPSVQGLVNSKSQPAAQTCLHAAKYGPNYEDLPEYNEMNPGSSWNAYHYQEEKTSINEKGFYKAEFTRDPDINCAADGSGVLNMRDDNDVPYTTIKLEPGVYVSVVEIWKVDMNENNLYDAGDSDYGGSNLPKEEEYFSDNGTENGGGSNIDQQTVNSADKRSQISKGDVRDLMANDFHSRWAEPYETMFIPPDTDIWTLRGNTDDFMVDWGARYHDQYWTAGWSDWSDKYKDIFGNSFPNHNSNESSYHGEKNYFAPDRDPDERVGKLKVDLYGSFEERPDFDVCPANKQISTWLVSASDTDIVGDSTRLENMLPSAGDGWYVYVFSYDGDDRIPKLQTKCSDPDEQFHLGEFNPELQTEMIVESADKKAPSVLNDGVLVSGYALKDSLIRLTLFRMGGNVHNPNVDTMICSVEFRTTETASSVLYNTKNYMDKDGYVFVSNAPEGVDVNTNRCFAEEAGHYYWYEEFYNPDGTEIQPPNADGPKEWVDLERDPPEVTTSADVSVMVGEAFHDTAYVKLPDGETKTYHLYMRAYGPTSGSPMCDTAGKSNLLFESGPHEVKKSGTYPSAYTTSLTTGIVYWIETLVDVETDEIVAEGYCGSENEMTKIADTPAPGDTWEWTVGAPMAGEIVISAAKIISTTGLLGLGAWQLLDKNSWLMRKIINKQ